MVTFTSKKRILIIASIVVSILLIPLIAMLFTSEVKWGFVDFILMGGLMMGTGLMCELVIRKVKKMSHRIILCAVILIVLLLIWMELAVGIFGTPFAGS